MVGRCVCGGGGGGGGGRRGEVTSSTELILARKTPSVLLWFRSAIKAWMNYRRRWHNI